MTSITVQPAHDGSGFVHDRVRIPGSYLTTRASTVGQTSSSVLVKHDEKRRPNSSDSSRLWSRSCSAVLARVTAATKARKSRVVSAASRT